MTQITLECIQAKQTELAALIQKFSAQTPTAKTITVDEVEIDLNPGEHYAGAVLDSEGNVMHHLVLMAPRPSGDLNWKAAMEWAEDVGGELPTRQEQALLYANCKPHLRPKWHWSSEVHEEDASYAWRCSFLNGHQYNTHKSFEGSAVAVRLIHITA